MCAVRLNQGSLCLFAELTELGTNLSNPRVPSTPENTHSYVKFYYYFVITELGIYLGIRESRLTKIKVTNFY